ncbi:hypothetical protein [Paenibacillus sp. YAF4_2]|uniref:hypothetical protein n=1 Tax=Paenibacillus sp. YAF4_2 TaxID=3233085 RepID=UPI003F9C90E2
MDDIKDGQPFTRLLELIARQSSEMPGFGQPPVNAYFYKVTGLSYVRLLKIVEGDNE